MTGLQKIKLILGIDDASSDEILTLLLKKCEMWVRGYCEIFDIGTDYELISLDKPLMSVIEDLAVIRYNKIGSEGLTSEAVGPLNMSYEELSPQITAVLSGYKRVRF